MEKKMENMENEMEAGIIQGLYYIIPLDFLYIIPLDFLFGDTMVPNIE